MPLSPPSSYLPTLRNLRWTSGLVLWVYVTLHLSNHAVGLVSLQAADSLRRVFHGAWDTLPGSLLLYGAFATHFVLACVALWRRRSLRMPPVEAMRVLLALGLPLLLVAHVTSTRWAHEAFALEASYARIVRAIWSPEGLTLQLTLLSLAWAHGCLGLHLALRRHARWQRWQPLWLALALLLPILAALGMLSMAREIAWGAVAPARSPSPQESAAMGLWIDGLRGGWLALLLVFLAARWGRAWRERRRAGAQVELHYPDRMVRVPRGWSVLEACRTHGIGMLSLCDGRARCSTCRVRVQGPSTHLPPPGRDEWRTLQRVKAPPDVRLACQLRPQGSITVVPLFQPGTARMATVRRGEERSVAVLFVDLRRWSGLAERQLPFDLVYVLDQYFALVGAAVRESGGLPNQFIGDSVMALFGLETDLPRACRQAVQAAALIEQRMDAWSAAFETQFGQRLDFGMGLHAGAVAVGQVGYQETTTFSAVGEVVNTASRLQDYSKVAEARLVMSLDAARLAEVDQQLGQAETLAVRGRSEPLAVVYVERPSALWGVTPVA
jgi:adenylate cyclase